MRREDKRFWTLFKNVLHKIIKIKGIYFHEMQFYIMKRFLCILRRLLRKLMTFNLKIT